MHRERSPPSDPPLADVQADLFFTLVAVMLPAILLLLPAARMVEEAPSRQASAVAAALARSDLRLGGAPARVFRATPEGVAHGAAVIPVHALPDDPTLRSALADARREGRPVLLLIEPGGEEAAFLFEAAAAAHGPDRIAQARLPRGCAGLKAGAAAVC